MEIEHVHLIEKTCLTLNEKEMYIIHMPLLHRHFELWPLRNADSQHAISSSYIVWSSFYIYILYIYIHFYFVLILQYMWPSYNLQMQVKCNVTLNTRKIVLPYHLLLGAQLVFVIREINVFIAAKRSKIGVKIWFQNQFAWSLNFLFSPISEFVPFSIVNSSTSSQIRIIFIDLFMSTWIRPFWKRERYHVLPAKTWFGYPIVHHQIFSKSIDAPQPLKSFQMRKVTATAKLRVVVAPVNMNATFSG